MRKRAFLFVVATLLFTLLGLAPVAGASVRVGPSGNKFYAPPTKLIAGPHGSVIWARTMAHDAELSAARRKVLVLYRSKSSSGRAIAVSGTIAIPKRRPPEGGWPIIAWDHATTGVADRCAPSKGFLNPGNGEVKKTVLNGYLRRGYAVVETDYEGLGTPGMHPWLIGRSEARSVIDNVIAARAIDRRIGRRWLPTGVSQGGHSSLWAAALARTWGKQLRLVGVAALAPSYLNTPFFEHVRGLTAPSPETGWAATLIAGASTVGVDVRSLLTPLGLSLMSKLDSTCYLALKEPNSLGGVAPAEFIRQDADLTQLYRVLAANEPDTLHIRVPVFVGQGTEDTAVPPAVTEFLVGRLRANGASVEYHTYPATHGVPEVLASREDVAAFAAHRFGRGR